MSKVGRRSAVSLTGCHFSSATGTPGLKETVTFGKPSSETSSITEKTHYPTAIMLKFLMVLVVLSAAAGDDPPKNCAEIQLPCKCVGDKIESIQCICADTEHDDWTLSQLLEKVSATTTTNLDIQRCKFNVTVDDLKDYTSLTKLTLGNNEIFTIAPSAFATLVVLTELDLQYNHLNGTTLTADVFSGLEALTTLLLQFNDITKFEGVAFSGDKLKTIERLDLEGNKLTELGDAAFDKLVTLGTLSVKDNHALTMVNFSSGALPSLKILNLAGNKLTSLNNWCLGGSKKLEELYASGNQITEVSEDTFDKDVSKTLLKVDLHNNKLTPTLSSAFTSPVKLQYLDLADNLLYWMDDSALKWDKLQTLHMHNNPWECECRNVWLLRRSVITNPHNETTDGLTCGSPEEVRDKPVDDKAVKEFFKCPGHSSGNGTTAAGFGIGLIVGLLLAVICFVIYCRYSASKKRNSQYSHHINT